MSRKDFEPTEAAVAAIKEELGAYEGHRLAARRQLRWLTPLMLAPAAIVALAGLLLLVSGEPPPLAKDRLQFTTWALLAVAILVSGGLWLAKLPSTRLQQSLRNRLLPTLFGFVGEIEYSHATRPFTFDYLPEAALPGHLSAGFGDVVRGRYDWMRFELFELHLIGGGKGEAKRIFDGVVVGFDIPGEFEGLLLVTPRIGVFSRFFRDVFKGKLPTLECGTSTLDAAFEIRSDNPDAARPLVSGPLGSALASVVKTWHGGPPRLALRSKVGFLLMPTRKDFFELPGVDTAASYERHIAPMVAQLTTVLETALLVRRAMAGKSAEDDGLLD